MRAVVILVAVMGCTPRGATADGSAIDRSVDRQPPFPEAGAPPPDIDSRPMIRMGLKDWHLVTNRSTLSAEPLTPTVYCHWMRSLAAVSAELEAGVRVRRRDGTAVPFLLKVGGSEANCKLALWLTPPLLVDVDYVLAVQPSTVLRPDIPAALFRLGSLPRVRRISSAKEFPSTNRIVTVEFSEPIDPVAVHARAFLRSGNTTVPMLLRLTVTQSTALDFAVDWSWATKPLTLRLSPEVFAPGGGKLDGDYSGNANGTAFELTFVIDDVLVQAGKPPWEPAVSF